MSTTARPRGSFGTTKTRIPDVMIRALAMHHGITGDPATFASPPISMAAFLLLITALAGAQQSVMGKPRGSATVRNTKRDAVWSAMDILRAYAQGLADILSPEAAAALLEAAGLLVAAVAGHQKPLLKATLTETPGVARVDANASLLVGPADASKKVFFNWQMSGNGGQTWADLRPTAYASTDVTGLTPMSTYGFRVCVTVGKVTHPWSQVVSLVIA